MRYELHVQKNTHSEYFEKGNALRGPTAFAVAYSKTHVSELSQICDKMSLVEFVIENFS